MRVETLPKGATLDTSLPIEEFASFEAQTRYLGSQAVVGALRALQRKRRELQGENDALKEEIRALRRKLAECKEREIEENMNRSVAREREFREQLESLEGKFKLKSGRKDAKSEALTTLLTSLKQQLATLSAKHKATLEDNTALQQKCANYEGEIRLLRSREKASVHIQSLNPLFGKSRKIMVTSAVERQGTGSESREIVGKGMKRGPKSLDESVEMSHLLAVPSTPLLFRLTVPSEHPRVRIQSLAASPSPHSASATL